MKGTVTILGDIVAPIDLDWHAGHGIDRSGAVTVPITSEVAVACHQLPGQLHSDPIDRILVATARNQNLTLVTRDPAILDDAAQGHVRALSC